MSAGDTPQGSVPRLFRGRIPGKKLERSMLRRIHLESERQFLMSVLDADAEGGYRIGRALTREEGRRLKRLATAIKANRGLIAGWKLSLVVFLLAGFLATNLLLRDRLAEAAGERALERIFGARAEITGLSFRPLTGNISFSALSVADRQNPMRNLFELAEGSLHIDTALLLRRRLIIEEMRCTGIRFHSPRESSGALPAGRRGRSERETASRNEDPAADPAAAGIAAELPQLGMEIGSAGAKALLSRYRERLEAPELIKETEQRYLTIRDEWQRRSGEMSTTSESLYAEAQSLAETAPDSFSDPARALAYLERVRQLEGEIESARAELGEAYRSYRQQRSFVEERSATITEAIEDDLRVLQEAAGKFSATAGRAISRSAAPILRERIGPAWGYAERALAVLERLHGEGGGHTRRYRDARRQGTTVTFPVRRTPRFLLRHFQLSGGADGNGESGDPAPQGESDLHSLTLRDLTGNQELSGRPTTLSLQSRDGSRQFSAELRFDLRPEATQRLSARGVATGVPVELQEGLEALAVDTLEAQTHTAFEIDIAPDGAGRGELNIRLEELRSSFTAASSPLAEASRSLLDGLDRARFDAVLDFTATELSGIELDSDLDERLAKRLETRLAKEAAALEEQLEAAFFGEFAEARQRSSALREEIEAQGRQLQEHLQTAEGAEQLTGRQAERIEERIAELRGGAEKRLREETEKKLEELKLPGF